ncbi:MAG: hypothetical protein ABIH00_06965 [Armatimonadota bacterium]
MKVNPSSCISLNIAQKSDIDNELKALKEKIDNKLKKLDEELSVYGIDEHDNELCRIEIVNLALEGEKPIKVKEYSPLFQGEKARAELLFKVRDNLNKLKTVADSLSTIELTGNYNSDLNKIEDIKLFNSINKELNLYNIIIRDAKEFPGGVLMVKKVIKTPGEHNIVTGKSDSVVMYEYKPATPDEKKQYELAKFKKPVLELKRKVIFKKYNNAMPEADKGFLADSVKTNIRIKKFFADSKMKEEADISAGVDRILRYVMKLWSEAEQKTRN